MEDAERVAIQTRAFTKFFNHEHLREEELKIRDIGEDLRDGIRLIHIVEAVQGRVCTEHIYSGLSTQDVVRTYNVQHALNSLRADGVRLVNVGPREIVDGNLEATLITLWRIVRRYHIPRCRDATQEALLMAWLQAVLPELKITNFHADWTDGIALSALVDYCQPGLLAGWRSFDCAESLQNCERALSLAATKLHVPTIVTPTDLCSQHSDEHSNITYLAYFVRRDGPGYRATLRDVQELLRDIRIIDLAKSWNDGFLLGRLVESVGGRVAGIRDMIFDDSLQWGWNIAQALEATSDLGVNTTLISPECITEVGGDNEHLGVLALSATLCSLRRADVAHGGHTKISSVVGGVGDDLTTMCFQNQRVNLDLVFGNNSSRASRGGSRRRRDIGVAIIGPNGSKLDEESTELTRSVDDADGGGVTVTFLPKILGNYKIHLFCNDKELPTSPIHLTVVNPSKAMPDFSGPPAEADLVLSAPDLSEPHRIGVPVEIRVKDPNAAKEGELNGKSEINIAVVSPSGTRSSRDSKLAQGHHSCDFTPDAVGDWLVEVRRGREHVQGSPFRCRCFDPSAVLVYGLDVGLVGQELKFTIDTTKAGHGVIKIAIHRKSGQHRTTPIVHNVDETADGIFHVRFTPSGAGQYSIRIEFNSVEVRGSPFLLDIANANSVTVHGESLHTACVNRPATFFIFHTFIRTGGTESKDLSVEITDSSGKKKHHPAVVPLDESMHKVEWKPSEIGEYSIDVLLSGSPIEESPFVCSVGDPDLVTVRNMPSRIASKELGTDQCFEIDAAAAGSGSMEILVNEGRVQCRVHELAHRKFQAAFTPVEAVDHKVELKFNNEHVRHSPWLLHFHPTENGTSHGADDAQHGKDESTADCDLVGDGLCKAEVGGATSFDLLSKQLRAGNLVVQLTDPDGKSLNVNIVELPGEGLRVCYTVSTVGEHRLEVLVNGRPMRGSPFRVFGYDPSKISVRTVDAGEYSVGRGAQFIVDAVEAGKGQLEISVNQGKVPNNVQMQDAGRCLVTFIPQHAGTYVIDVTFNGQQVHGCPIKVDVHTKEVGRIVSTPVYSTGAAGIAGSPPPPSVERGPSSAYYSTTDTYSSYAPTPPPYSAPSDQQHTGGRQRAADLPRSPLLVSYVQQRSAESSSAATTAEQQVSSVHKTSEHTTSPKVGDLRSPRLVTAYDSQVTQTRTPQQVGFTVAQYGGGSGSGSGGAGGGVEYSEVHRGAHHHQPQKAAAPRPIHCEDSSRLEMTRSAELTLYREEEGGEAVGKGGPVTKHHIYDEIPVSRDTVVEKMHRSNELAYVPLGEMARRTADSMRVREEDERILERHGYQPYGVAAAAATGSQAPTAATQHTGTAGGGLATESVSQVMMEDEPYIVQSHVVEPYSSDTEAMTPGTRRKLLEHSVYKAADLKESEIPSRETTTGGADTDHDDHGSEAGGAGSKHSSKATTPRLGMKFRRSSEKSRASDQLKPFEFGKSKIASKNEVVRKGKEVEVKIESLKLGKEDQLKVVVTPPTRKNLQPGEHASPPELAHNLRKSRNTYIVEFTPTDVGTYKVLAFVNTMPHPQAPFPIRVYDASQIIVGEIVHESLINDTVEFTVDAGRAGFGNLEMAIKDSDGLIIPSHVSQLEAGTAKFLVTFNPATVGVHTVNITFNKETVRGSPFNVNVVEPVDTERSSSVADSKSSTMEKGKKKEKLLKKEEKRKEKNGTWDRQKKGDASQALVSKFPSLIRVDGPAELVLSLPSRDTPVEVSVTDPERKHLPVEILDDGENRAKRIQFTPLVVGDHEVMVRVNGEDVNGSPFTCRAYDPARILVGAVPDGAVGKAVHFTVDASSAGVGNLEVAVNDGKIPSMAHALGQHRYDISFVPKEPIDHTISVRFNNEPVPGSPFVSRFGTASSARQSTASAATEPNLGAAPSARQVTASGPGLERIPVGEPAEIWISVDQAPTGGAERPEVVIIDSKGMEPPVELTSQSNERFTAIYTPLRVGNHQIDIRYAGEPIHGSPFISKAFDASAVRLSLDPEKAVVGRACTFSIDAAKAGAGNMEIIVSVGKRNVPNFVQAEGQARFKVSFTPQEPSDHTLSVKFNGIPIRGSPLRCPVTELTPTQQSSPAPIHYSPDQDEVDLGGVEEIKLVGDLAAAQVGKLKRFSIDASGRNQECNVLVTYGAGADKRRVPVKVVRVKEGFDVEFTPNRPGNYEIDIQLNGKSLELCPVVCKAISLRAPESSDRHQRIGCGETFEFEVELPRHVGSDDRVVLDVCDEEGEDMKSSVKVDYKQRRAVGTFRTRNEPSSYFATLLSNGVVFEERIYSSYLPSKHRKRSLDVKGVRIVKAPEKALVDQSAEFELEVGDGLEEELQIEINDPDGETVPVSLVQLTEASNLFAAEWQPAKEGQHSIFVRLEGQSIEGTPLFVDALDLSAVRVIGLDEPRNNDSVGVQHTFNLDWSNSGGSAAAVKIQHENGAEAPKCHLKLLKQGVHRCTFTPRLPGLYLIDIAIDDITLPECPYECLISDKGAIRARGDALLRAQRGRTARFEVSLGDADRGDLDVLITDEHKSPLPVRCYKQQDDSYWVEFTPEQTGRHAIEVTFAERPIAGSPFTCEVVDPRKIVVKGVETPLTVNHVSNILINRRHAGSGELKVELSDPQQHRLKLEKLKRSDEEESYQFLPIKLGPHKLNVTLSGFVVPGMPKTVLVEEQSQPSAYGAAIDYAVECDQQASIIFNSKGVKGGLKVDVRGPNNERIRHSTDKRPDNTTEISFKPSEVGEYEASIEFNNKPIAGSPYKISVVDPSKLRIIDGVDDADGIVHMDYGNRRNIDIDATSTGPGALRVELRNADGELVTDATRVLNLGFGKHRVQLDPERPGRHKLYLYWAGLVVPSAYPVMVDVRDGSGRAAYVGTLGDGPPSTSNGDVKLDSAMLGKVVLSGTGLTHAVVKEPAEFTIDCSRLPPAYADRRLIATLIGDKADVPVRITPLPSANQTHRGVYTPLVMGKYELNVLLDGKHVGNSPTHVDVEGHGSSAAAAELIEVDAKSLKMGIIGEDVKTLIDARHAGAGHLSAQCIGPSQMEFCELFDNHDGTYVLRVTPRELGKHTLNVKYDGQHVPGSPFVFPVSNPPDPMAVRVYGSGIEHGVLHNYNSNFVVETKGAGAGQLSVRVRGPKGAFNVEMQRDRHNERTIHCKYDPKEPGDYQIEVKWHGMHVPGSPFIILIVDTEMELQRFLAGGAPSPIPPSPFMPPGMVMGPGGPGWPPPPPPPHFGPMPIPPPDVGPYGYIGGVPMPPHLPPGPRPIPPQHGTGKSGRRSNY